MADYFDNDTLVSKGQGDVFLNLTCGYAQAIATTVHVKDGKGKTTEVSAFTGECTNKNLGANSVFRYNRIIVFSTVHDTKDTSPGQLVEDINVKMEITCDGESVDASFIKETKGSGSMVKCTYEVILL